MIKEDFFVDERIASSCFKLGDWPLSTVYLKNNALYPWFILVPRVDNMREIYDLPASLSHQLMDEIRMLSSILNIYFNPDKLNVGYLGNIVNQLHVHIVGRSVNDALWPHGIWQAAQESTPYEHKVLEIILRDLTLEIENNFKDRVINS